MRITPAKRMAHRPAFQMPILILKKMREKMTVKRGAVKIMVRASPRGRNARLLKKFSLVRLLAEPDILDHFAFLLFVIQRISVLACPAKS